MSLFVTVGSTGFDELVKQATLPAFLDVLAGVGIRKVVYQYGSSEACFLQNLQEYTGKVLDIDGYKYKPSINQDMEEADMVISHAGAGTILQALRLKKKLIVVVNKSLMDNHQYELAKAMQDNRYALCSEIDDLTNAVQMADTFDFAPFPTAEPELFAAVVDEEMGFTSLD